MVSEDQIVLDVTDNDLTVVVRVPEGKQLWLVSLSLESSQVMLDQAPARLEFFLGFLSLCDHRNVFHQHSVSDLP